MKTYFGIAVLLSTLLVAPATWAIETSPDILVDNTAQEILAIIKQDKDIQSGNKAKILDLVEAKILPHFNFARMTRLAMGKNWSKATPQQQQELEKQFRTLLVRTYYKALSVYSHHTIKVVPLNTMAGDTNVTVKTQVMQSHGPTVTINYSMEKTSSGWKVYDITVSGISLVINYRGSFNSQIRKGGVEGLLKTLSEKNRTLDEKDKEKSAALVKQLKIT
ncbi:MAG: ABC transporter substrate-binding protein [Betaproteobacteria bacterium]|nr:MAG: ABC transporter substrate-binding protein [Betaproteobacteria bacterium]